MNDGIKPFHAALKHFAGLIVPYHTGFMLHIRGELAGRTQQTDDFMPCCLKEGRELHADEAGRSTDEHLLFWFVSVLSDAFEVFLYAEGAVGKHLLHASLDRERCRPKGQRVEREFPLDGVVDFTG